MEQFPKSSGDQTQPAAPTVEPAVAPAAPSPVASKKAPNKKLLLGGVAAVVVALIAGVSVYAWWNSPEKVFNDAIYGSTAVPYSVKGNMKVSQSSGPGATIEFDGKMADKKFYVDTSTKVDAGMMNFNLKASLAADANKDMYFRVQDVRKTVQTFAGDSMDAIEQYYGDVINKVDNKWVRITSADVKDMTKDSGADVTCMQDTLISVLEDKSLQSELKKVTQDKNNQYASIKEVVGTEKVNNRDSIHYKISIDATKYKSYTKAIGETSLMKRLESCVKDQSEIEDINSINESDMPTIELWVDKGTHHMSRMMMTSKSGQSDTSATLDATFGYDKVPVDMPKADTEFKDLKQSIEQLQSQMSPSTGSSSFSTETL